MWHTSSTATRSPAGRATTVRGELDWDRRHALMRTHTALHVLCGVIWNEWGTAVTGGNMEPLSARMDFEFDPLPEGFGAAGRGAGQRRAGRRPADRGVVPAPRDGGRGRGPDPHQGEPDPRVGAARSASSTSSGLDKQADGGTHVRTTAEVGRIRVVKTESKGKGNKRIRIEVVDA